MRKINFLFLVLFLLIMVGKSNAQEKDFRLWLTAGVDKKLNKRIGLSLRASLRQKDNALVKDNIFTDLGVNYKLIKRLKLDFRYRYSVENGFNRINKRSRFYLALIYKIKTGTKFGFEFTPAYQVQFTNYATEKRGKLPENYLRFEALANYNFKKIDPFFAIEIFYYWDYNEYGMNRIRYRLGTELQLSKRNKIELSGIVQQAIGNNKPTSDFITAIGYKYSF